MGIYIVSGHNNKINMPNTFSKAIIAIIISSLLLLSGNAFGQAKPIKSSSKTKKDKKASESNLPLPDTITIRYLLAETPEIQTVSADTGLVASFYQYDPIRSGTGIYANLGYLGSAMHRLVYEQPEKQGFDVGLHQFDAYYLPATQLRFYNTFIPYSKVYYSQGASKDDAEEVKKQLEEAGASVELK